MPWFSGDDLNAPAAGTVVADSGALPGGGTIPLSVVLTATSAVTILVQHRDAANTANVAQVRVRVPANDTRAVVLGSVTLAGGERVRAVTEGVTTGRVQAVLALEV